MYPHGDGNIPLGHLEVNAQSRGGSRVDEKGGAQSECEAPNGGGGGGLGGPPGQLKILHHYMRFPGTSEPVCALGFTRKHFHCPKRGGRAPGAPPPPHLDPRLQSQ